MNDKTTQKTWMDKTNVMREKHDAVTSRSTTTLEASRDQKVELRMPDIVVSHFDANDREKSRLRMGGCSLIECVYAKSYFDRGTDTTCWISLGYADLVETDDSTNNGRPWKVGEAPTTHLECEFRPLSYKSLMAGIRPEYVLLKEGWSKNHGSVFEEVNPFEACCRWAGARGALYVGRKDSRVSFGLAATHGVDYIVLPVTTGNAAQLEVLLKEYIGKLQQAIGAQEERKERLKSHVDAIGNAAHNLGALLIADAEERARVAEEQAVERAERERLLRNMTIGGVCGLMTVQNYSRARAMS